MKNTDSLDQLRLLVADTLLFLCDRCPNFSYQSLSLVQPKAQEIEKISIKIAHPETAIPKKSPVIKEIFPPKEKTPIELPATLVSTKKDESMLRLIFDHLPHLTIVKEIPSQNQISEVIIFVKEKNELPFLQNLAKAIQQHFCPVKLIDMQKILALKKENKVFAEKKEALFLLPSSYKETFPKELKGIFLVETKVYAENIEEKKLLWTEICRILKPSLQK